MKPGKSLLAIIGPGRDGEGGGDDDAPDSSRRPAEENRDDSSGMKMDAARNLSAAVKSGDTKGIVEAFEDLCQLCYPG